MRQFLNVQVFSVQALLLLLHWHYTELPNDPSITIITILITVRGNRRTFTLSLSHTQHGHHKMLLFLDLCFSLFHTSHALLSQNLLPTGRYKGVHKNVKIQTLYTTKWKVNEQHFLLVMLCWMGKTIVASKSLQTT